MRALILTVIGMIFTTLLLLAPAIHASTWLGAQLDAAAWALIVVPFVVLVVAVTTSVDWIKLYLFPVAHLPPLLAIPAMTDRLVYEGGGGFWALAAIAVTGTAWYAVTVWPEQAPDDAPKPPRQRVHPLTGLSFAMGLGIFSVFVVAAFKDPDVAPFSANITLVAGALVTWYVVGRALVTELGDVVLDPQARSRYRTLLMVRRRPSRRGVIVSTAIAALTLSVALLWYTLR